MCVGGGGGRERQTTFINHSQCADVISNSRQLLCAYIRQNHRARETNSLTGFELNCVQIVIVCASMTYVVAG